MSHRQARGTLVATLVCVVAATACSNTSRRQSLQVVPRPTSVPTTSTSSPPPPPAGWSRIPTAPTPEGSIALWTGHELVLGKGCCTDSNAEILHAYDPLTQTWRAFPPAPLPPRLAAVAGSTDHEVVVFGGTGGLNGVGMTDGAALDPATGQWRAIAPLPEGVSWGPGAAKAIWTGKELVVWKSGNGLTPVGAEVLLAFDPAANGWRRLPPSGLSPRTRSTVAWTGTRLIVWGGQGPQSAAGNVALADGAMLDPVSGRWTRIPNAPVTPQYVTSAVWAGSQLIVLGGSTDPAGATPGEGASFDPVTSRWRRLPPSPLPATGQTAPVWTGTELFVTGLYRGSSSDVPPAAVYDPASGKWRRLTPAPVVSNTMPRLADDRSIAFATWTGEEVLVMVGLYGFQQPLDGFTWTPGG